MYRERLEKRDVSLKRRQERSLKSSESGVNEAPALVNTSYRKAASASQTGP